MIRQSRINSLLTGISLGLLIAGLPAVAQAADAGLLQLLAANKKLVVLAIAAVALVVAIWLIYRRYWKLLVLGVVVAAIAVFAIGVHQFNKRYPNQAVFSASRISDSTAILLGQDARLSQFHPEPFLKVERSVISHAAYPAIDIHFHLESLPPDITPERLVHAMDEAGIAKLTNLGGLPGMFEHFATTFRDKYPDRFILFVKPDVAAIAHQGGIAEQVEWIRKAARMGAQGMKFNKSLGLGHVDETGKLVRVDDPRLDPIWEEAAHLGLPIVLHIADNIAFFKKPDVNNERYVELIQNPQWSYYGRPGYPTFEELMSERETVLQRHPNTIIIGAHMGCDEDDLAYVSYMLDKYPNYYVDMSSVVHALGRQPVTSRKFFIKYQDRILFGSDGGFMLANDGDGWTAERMYRSYEEFLETDNEYIKYPLADITHQGNWRVYGIKLPPEVLEKIYVRNAEKLIPSKEAVLQRLAAESTSAAPAAATSSIVH
jgi:predicted TIM-barrel fold metal-dependent hydrolase